MQKTILFIEDNKILEDIVESFMRRLRDKYKFITANNGSDGLKKAKELKPDVIILDIVFPNENGWDIAQRLRNDQSTCEIPIIVASGAGSPFDKTPYVESDQIDGYLRKPYDMPQLLAAIDEAILK